MIFVYGEEGYGELFLQEDLDRLIKKAAFRNIHSKPASLDDLLSGCVKANELSSISVPEKRQYLGDFMKEGDTGFIYSWRGTGKTWFALDLARGLTQGKLVGPWHSFVQVPVVYVDGEMPADLMKSRMHLLGIVESERFILLNHELLFHRTSRVLNLTKPETQDAIAAFCLYYKS